MTVPGLIDYEDVRHRIRIRNIRFFPLPILELYRKRQPGKQIRSQINRHNRIENNSGDAQISGVDHLFTIGSYTTDADGNITKMHRLTNSGQFPQSIRFWKAARSIRYVPEKCFIPKRRHIPEADEHDGASPCGRFHGWTALPIPILMPMTETKYTGIRGKRKTWEVNSINGSTVTSVIHKEEINVDFANWRKSDKEFDISWDNIHVPANSLTPDPYSSETVRNDPGIIRWRHSKSNRTG